MMVGEKIKYVCKNCGWSASIRVEWGDLKPKRCAGKRCNTNFQKSPDALEIHKPEEKQNEPVSKVVAENQNKTKKFGKKDDANSKKEDGSKIVEQQTESENS